MNSGIYCIENVENGMRYIGKSENLKRRIWHSHNDCQFIGRAIEKYKDCIIRYVIEYCEPKDLTYWEKYYIREWDTKSPNGYNLTDGGDGGGANPSEETRKRMSIAQTGKRQSIETIEKRRAKIVGLCRSFESIKRISESRKGDKNPNFGKKASKALSKYFGVSKTISYSKNKIYVYWITKVCNNNKKEYVGCYKMEIEAAKAYNNYIVGHNINHPLNTFSDEQ